MDREIIIRKTFGINGKDNLPYYTERTRNDFPKLFAELGYLKGAEIGVCRGRFTESLCLGNPELHMLCVDPWMMPRERRPYRHAMARLPKYNVTVMRTTSLEAARQVPDQSLDFVYIDALHDFDSVIQDLLAWVPKVKPGGAVSGHDYFAHTGFGVIQAVDAYTRAHNIQSWYLTSDWPPSYLWLR